MGDQRQPGSLKLGGVKSLNRRLFGVVLTMTGIAMLASPIRRYRAVWHVTVGDKPARSRVLRGGAYVSSSTVMLQALRSGERRPDAELRSLVGLTLIGSGLMFIVMPGELQIPQPTARGGRPGAP